MKIYVAGKFELADRVRETMFQLVDAGHTITYDWTLQTEVNAAQAVADLRGVVEADALVAVFEHLVSYRGALVEFGVALGLGKPIYVIGNALDDHLIFLHHPSVRRGIESLLKRPSPKSFLWGSLEPWYN